MTMRVGKMLGVAVALSAATMLGGGMTAAAAAPPETEVADFEDISALEETEDVNAAAAPKFSAPFKCKQKWKGTTYTGHWPNTNSRDFWRSGGATKGQPVLAAAGGTVIHAKFGSRQGWGVSMNNGSGYKSYYFHMTAKPKVKNGQKIKKGTLLGYVGDTGQAKGNPHLHYTVTLKDKGIKPVFDGKAHKAGTTITSKNSC